jgi:hypothetical protein
MSMANHSNERIVEADFSGAWFHSVNFSNVKISNAWLFNVDISGLVGNLSVNGVDVSAFVETELNKRHPERLLLAPFDADGMRTAWTAIEAFSGATLVRARALPPEKLNESVAEEWSFVETLRHLVFATDRWITGPVLRDPNPFHPLGCRTLRTTARRGNTSTSARADARRGGGRAPRTDGPVADLVKGVNADDLNRQVPSPNGGTTSVMSCLHVVFRDEWWHDQYANRDLAILERGAGA